MESEEVDESRLTGRVVGKGDLVGVTCIGPECDLPARAHYLCITHYHQKWRGAKLTPRRGYKKRDEQ